MCQSLLLIIEDYVKNVISRVMAASVCTASNHLRQQSINDLKIASYSEQIILLKALHNTFEDSVKITLAINAA